MEEIISITKVVILPMYGSKFKKDRHGYTKIINNYTIKGEKS